MSLFDALKTSLYENTANPRQPDNPDNFVPYGFAEITDEKELREVKDFLSHGTFKQFEKDDRVMVNNRSLTGFQLDFATLNKKVPVNDHRLRQALQIISRAFVGKRIKVTYFDRFGCCARCCGKNECVRRIPPMSKDRFGPEFLGNVHGPDELPQPAHNFENRGCQVV